MSYRVLDDVVIENNGMINVIKKGTMISEITHVLDDEDTDVESDKDQLMSVIHDWINTYKDSFGKSMNTVKTVYLQPAIDAIQSSDSSQLKDTAIRLVRKIESVDDLKVKQKFSLIHNLYIKLLGMAKGVFGESIEEIINIIKECKF